MFQTRKAYSVIRRVLIIVFSIYAEGSSEVPPPTFESGRALQIVDQQFAPSLYLSPKGRYLVCGGYVYDLHVNAMPLKPIATLLDQEYATTGQTGAFSASGNKFLVYSPTRKSVDLWKVPEWKMETTFPIQANHFIGFGNRSRTIIAADADVTLFDAMTGHTIRTVSSGGHPFLTACLTSERIYLGDFDNGIQVWSDDLTKCITERRTTDKIDRRSDRVGQPGNEEVIDVSVSRTGRKVATAHGDGSVRIWSRDCRSVLQSYVTQEQWIESVEWLSNDRFLLVCGGGRVDAYDAVEEGAIAWNWQSKDGLGTHTYAAVSLNGHVVAVADLGGEICVWVSDRSLPDALPNE